MKFKWRKAEKRGHVHSVPMATVDNEGLKAYFHRCDMETGSAKHSVYYVWT